MSVSQKENGSELGIEGLGSVLSSVVENLAAGRRVEVAFNDIAIASLEANFSKEALASLVQTVGQINISSEETEEELLVSVQIGKEKVTPDLLATLKSLQQSEREQRREKKLKIKDYQGLYRVVQHGANDDAEGYRVGLKSLSLEMQNLPFIANVIEHMDAGGSIVRQDVVSLATLAVREFMSFSGDVQEDLMKDSDPQNMWQRWGAEE